MMNQRIVIYAITVIMLFNTMETIYCVEISRYNKRLPNPIDQYALATMKEMAHTKYLDLIKQSIETLLTRERRTHMTDAGYGSRVSLGNRIAAAHMARHGFFGINGPGRR